MTPSDMIRQLRQMGPQDAAKIFRFIGEHVYDIQLSDGTRLTHGDPSDLVVFFFELAAAAQMQRLLSVETLSSETQGTKGQLAAESGTRPLVTNTGLRASRFNRPTLEMRLEQQRAEMICHHCSHVHEGHNECGVDMGGAGKCECRAEVRV